MMDRLRAKWRDKLFSGDSWKHNYQRGLPIGYTDPMWLHGNTAAPFGAVFKPCNRDCRHPVAAREKIAGDLGYDLEIPVAPVLLYDNVDFHWAPRWCCVSLVTHPQVPPWQHVVTRALLSTLSTGERASMGVSLSLIAAFDLWIGNPDRDNPGNMAFGEDSDAPKRNGFYAFDHDLAFGGASHSWRDGGWKAVIRMGFPKLLHQLLDKGVMLRAVSAIEVYSETKLRSCVERIPDEYMSKPAKEDVVNGLLGRKHALSDGVSQYFPEG